MRKQICRFVDQFLKGILTWYQKEVHTQSCASYHFCLKFLFFTKKHYIINKNQIGVLKIQISEINKQIHRLTIPYKDIYTTVLFIRTEEGIVIFDTATFETDVTDYILPAMEELQIKKEEIKYIFISHNHGDHAGGLLWLMPELPKATIVSNSPTLLEKYAEYSCRSLADGEHLTQELQFISIPGHTPDAGALLDLRTKTLMTGDSLQVYGIYGSGKWGANVRWPKLHFEALERLLTVDAEHLVMAHDYHLCGPIVHGKSEVQTAIKDCAEALNKIQDFLVQNPDLDDDTLMERYNADSGLPTVSARVFAGLRETI